MIRLPYDESFDPPAPVLPARLGLPDAEGWLQLAALVDTGADITLVPEDVAERYLPVAGTIRIRGATGNVQDAVLYRAEISVGDLRRVLIVAAWGNEAVVGRDLLRHLIVRLDGPAQRMTVAAPA